MSCLFYCICRHPGPVLPAPLLGVGGGPVYRAFNHPFIEA